MGKLEIISDGEYITGINFASETSETSETDNTEHASGDAVPVLADAEKQLNEYFSGIRNRFTVPVKAEGTPFQKAVWRAMSEIPYGEKLTYKSLASAAERPGAFRAVGSACGANPVPIIIPCHRVVASNGEGGFSGGLDIKRALLELEESIVSGYQRKTDK